MTTRGFTLLEVMVAAALLSIVTAGAMAAFLAQSRATNTQQQTTVANDGARETLRLVSNDVRGAAAGITPGAGGVTTCDPGTIPFDGSGATPIACLPPVFRSNTPLILPTAAVGAGTTFAPSCGDATHPGYQLNLGGGVTVPPGASAFCPDDLIVLGVDDANPLFMVQSSPGVSSVGNVTTINFGGTAPIARNLPSAGNSPAGAGYGFDDSTPLNYLPLFTAVPACGLPAPYCEPLMLFGGPSGAVLMNTGYSGVANVWTAGGNANCAAGLPAPCDAAFYNLVPSTPTTDLFRNNLAFGSIAMPAHLYRYSIEPLDATNTPSNCVTTACVSANLVRSLVVPTTVIGAAGTSTLNYQTLSSTTLIKGVVDMQVEFGLQSTGATGQSTIIYVNSGGLQANAWPAPYTAASQPAIGPNNADNCAGGALDPGVWTGVCFPTGGSNGMNAVANLRTVRLNLTVRSGAEIQTRTGTAYGSAAAIGALPTLQASVQDLAPAGNKEANQWGWRSATGWGSSAYNLTNGPQPQDGATYRQVSTEVYIRNLGWTNNL